MTQHYQIRIKDHIDESWADWLNGLAIHHEDNGETLLTGSLPDQAALHGVLNRLRDLGIELISVNPLDDGHAEGGETD
ncbi:MAG: hypothetical protein R3E39_31980 [Anaerolineae bacterium]